MNQLNPSLVRLRASVVLRAGAALCLLLSFSVAQEIGHLGVNTEPIPLRQVRQPVRRYVARATTPRNTISRPDPDSPNLLVSIDNIGDPRDKPSSPDAPTPVKPKETAPPKLSPFEEQLLRAERLAAEKDQAGVIAAFRQALALKPDAVEARARLADALADDRKYAEADAEYQKVLAQKPGSIDARRGRGDALYQLKKYNEAVEEYRAAIQAGADDAGLYNNLANALYRTTLRENRVQAIENYRQAIAKQKDTSGMGAAQLADFYAGLANALRTNNQLAEAQTAVERALQLTDQSALAHSVAGRIYAERGDFARANAEAQRAIALAPKQAYVYVNHGAILYAQKRWLEAVNAYTTAQSYDRNWAVTRNGVGSVYLNGMNRPAEAIDEFKAAAEFEPRSSIIHNNLGTAYARQRKFDEAIANFKLAAEYDDKNPSPLVNLGAIYQQQGKRDEADAQFRLALQREPKNAPALASLALLRMEQKRAAEAIGLLEQAVALEPTDGALARALGDAYKAAGRKKESKDAYARAESLGIKVKEK